MSTCMQLMKCGDEKNLQKNGNVYWLITGRKLYDVFRQLFGSVHV